MPWLTRFSELELRMVDQERVELETELLFLSDQTGDRYRVPPGFVSDLASVPRWLRSLAPTWQESARAGLLHDYAYRIGAHPVGVSRSLSREEADDLLYEGLRADGVGRVRAWAMWAAVRAFGGRSWWRRKVKWRPGLVRTTLSEHPV